MTTLLSPMATAVRAGMVPTPKAVMARGADEGVRGSHGNSQRRVDQPAGEEAVGHAEAETGRHIRPGGQIGGQLFHPGDAHVGLRNQPCQPRGEPYDEEGGEGSHHPARPRHHGSEGSCKAAKNGVGSRSACVPEEGVSGPASAGNRKPPAHPDAVDGESRTISLGDRVREDSRAVVEAIRAPAGKSCW